MALTPEQLREYARMGAAVRLAELSDEIKMIHAEFPELRTQSRTAGPATPTRRRRTLTAAEKKFISERMKKYWSARKKKA